MDTEAIQFFNTTKVSQIKERNALITLSSNDSINVALQTLTKAGITGAPVVDPINKQFIGFVDNLDLTMFIASVFAENYKRHPHLYDPKELERLFCLPVSDVTNASNRDPFLPMDIDASLSFLINNFLRFGIHRVPLKEGDNIVGIVSQSDVVRFLQKHNEHIQKEKHKTLEQLGLNKGNVIKITNDETLIKAFMQIITHKISGIAVVEYKTGELVNNLSASDLKGITQESFWRLEVPIHQILLQLGSNKSPPVTCSQNTNLGELIDNFSKHGVHRIYVVDEKNIPMNVITLTDILNIFTTPIHIVPS